MTQGNQFRATLGCLNSRNPRHRIDITFRVAPAVMRATVSGSISTTACATATRLLACLPVISTMRAAPLASRWDRVDIAPADAVKAVYYMGYTPVLLTTHICEKETADAGFEPRLQLGYWGALYPANHVALAQEAERLGFDSVWTAESWGNDCLHRWPGLAPRPQVSAWAHRSPSYPHAPRLPAPWRRCPLII